MKVGSLEWFDSEIKNAVKMINQTEEFSEDRAQWITYYYELQEKKLKFEKEIRDMANQERDRDIKEKDIEYRFAETKMQCRSQNLGSWLKFLGAAVGAGASAAIFLWANQKRSDGELVRDDDTRTSKSFMGLFEGLRR